QHPKMAGIFFSQNRNYMGLRRIRNLMPIECRREVKELSRLALPVFLTYIMVYLISFVSTVFCGHLGSTELDGVALAVAVINVTGVAVGYGLASACDTLISQALYAFIIETTYLQNQGIMWPLVITGAVANILNALSNYVLVLVLNLGVTGSAAANVISQYTMAIVLFMYIRCRGLHKDTWNGWSVECLQEWDTFIHLAIPGMLMLCAEWWTYELGAFLAGLVSQVELGAQAVIYELANIAYMVPIGFSMAGSVRVGNAMGAGDTARAQLSAKVGMSCAVSVAVCLAVIIGCSKNTVSYIFTNDEQIRQRVATVMDLYAPFHILDATAAAAGCIVRGLGKQKLGAIANLCGYYGVGFPIGVSLMFAAKLGIFGLWIGLLICVLLQSAFFIVLLLKMSWPKATEEAQIRAGVQPNRTEDASAEQPGAVEPRDLGRPTDTDALLEPPCICTAGKPLPLRILVLRRGFTLVLMLSVLAGGLVLNMTLNR
ncbi:hypothetical protein P4O66_017741, partial [Electrophorus voltai]